MHPCVVDRHDFFRSGQVGDLVGIDFLPVKPPPRFTQILCRARSTRICRIASAAAPKKCRGRSNAAHSPRPPTAGTPRGPTPWPAASGPVSPGPSWQRPASSTLRTPAAGAARRPRDLPLQSPRVYVSRRTWPLLAREEPPALSVSRKRGRYACIPTLFRPDQGQLFVELGKADSRGLIRHTIEYDAFTGVGGSRHALDLITRNVTANIDVKQTRQWASRAESLQVCSEVEVRVSRVYKCAQPLSDPADHQVRECNRWPFEASPRPTRRHLPIAPHRFHVISQFQAGCDPVSLILAPKTDQYLRDDWTCQSDAVRGKQLIDGSLLGRVGLREK